VFFFVPFTDPAGDKVPQSMNRFLMLKKDVKRFLSFFRYLYVFVSFFIVLILHWLGDRVSGKSLFTNEGEVRKRDPKAAPTQDDPLPRPSAHRELIHLYEGELKPNQSKLSNPRYRPARAITALIILITQISDPGWVYRVRSESNEVFIYERESRYANEQFVQDGELALGADIQRSKAQSFSVMDEKVKLSVNPFSLEEVSLQVERGSEADRLDGSGEIPASFQLLQNMYEPAGCEVPPDDDSIVQAGDRTISRRTLTMLMNAAKLYGGRFDLEKFSIITQSKLSGYLVLQVEVDGASLKISITRSGSSTLLYLEVDSLIIALRVAGFAAWFLEAVDPADAYILAVPVGDSELSDSELELIQGEFGYFSGFAFNEIGEPIPDIHGGPIICSWMLESNFPFDVDNLNQGRVGTPMGDWQENLRVTAQTFITKSNEETFDLARELGYLGGTNEHPSNMCGPLSAAMLYEAGLLPVSVGPLVDPKNFWLAHPQFNGRPWTLFPKDEYQVYRNRISTARFDFSEWPLCQGDVVFTYAGSGEFSHLLVVTEVDKKGRAYSVTNLVQPDGEYIVERILLYNPSDDSQGQFRNEWANDINLGRTGLGGFEVLRRKGTCLPSGSLVNYTVQPGDTLQVIAERFNTSIPAILEENGLANWNTSVNVNQTILIPVNLQSGEGHTQITDDEIGALSSILGLSSDHGIYTKYAK
jgi:hypothetical protein